MRKLIRKISDKPVEVLGSGGAYWFLAGIILFAFFFRLYFVFQTNFLVNDSYFGVRQVESIASNFSPIKYDDLSYGGREFVFNSLFYYIIGFFSLFSSSFALKVLPIIFSVSIVLIVYLMGMELTGNKLSSLISALLAGFIPVHVHKVLNHLSIYSLAVPLFFFMLYCLIKVDFDKKYASYLIVLSFALPLLHPVSFLLSLSMVFYFILNVIGNISMSRLKKEIILFSTLLVFLINFIIYKKAFLEQGIGVVWQNIPNRILGDYFVSFDITNAIFFIGLIPLMLGIIGFFYGFNKKKDVAVLLSSLSLSVFFLLSLKLISLEVGLIFLGFSLSVFSSLALSRVFSSLRDTKFHKYENLVFSCLFLFVLFFSIIPAAKFGSEIADSSLSKKEFLVFSWLKDNSLENETVMAPVVYGQVINYFSGRKSVIDEYYLLAPDVNERYEDVNRVYNSKSEVKALEILREYNAGYIYVPKDIDLEYVKDNKCFKKRKDGLYKVLC